MPNPPHTLTLRLSQPDGATYRLDLTSRDVGERRGEFPELLGTLSFRLLNQI